jgi:transcriptional regulator with GAF, ATPase, and Fis domain
MTPEEAMKLAYTLAESARTEEQAQIAASEAAMSFPIREPEATDLPTPMFPHERELSEALRAISLLASGRNPFSDEPLGRLRQEQQKELLRSLSIVVCTLVGTPTPLAVKQTSIEFDTPEDASESSSDRPLEQYLDRLERQAILKALAEARNNQAEAARLLGITYRSYRYRVDRLKIDV